MIRYDDPPCAPDSDDLDIMEGIPFDPALHPSFWPTMEDMVDATDIEASTSTLVKDISIISTRSQQTEPNEGD